MSGPKNGGRSLALLALIAQSRALWGTLATISLVLIGGAFAFAGSQEPILLRTLSIGISGTTDVLVLVIAVGGTAASLALVVAALRELLTRLRRSRRSPSRDRNAG